MNYAELKTYDIANGPGIRLSLLSVDAIIDVPVALMNRLGILITGKSLHRKLLITLLTL